MYGVRLLLLLDLAVGRSRRLAPVKDARLPRGGANRGGGEDLFSIWSAAMATATGVRLLCVGLRCATHDFLPASIELLPPPGQVFRVADRRHPASRAHRRWTRPLQLPPLQVNQPRQHLRCTRPLLQAHGSPRRQAQCQMILGS